MAKAKKTARKARSGAPNAAPAAQLEPANPREITLSISQAAAEFGRDRATVTKRIAELGVRPAGERRGHPVYRLRELLEMERRTPDGQLDPESLPPFERHAHYKAESERLRVDTERGMLMRREEVEREWARVLKVIALELDTVIDEIERDVGASPLVLEQIERKLDVIRERMYAGVVRVGHLADEEYEGGGDVA